MPDNEVGVDVSALTQELENPWDKAYWFARMLIDTDQYGHVGGSQDAMIAVSGCLSELINTMDPNDPSTLDTLRQALHGSLLQGRRKGTGVYAQIEKLYEDLSQSLLSVNDYKVFVLTCSKIMIPINIALTHVPNDDINFTNIIAHSILDAKGADGLATLINIWDNLGTHGCITAERTQVVMAFGWLRTELESILSRQDQNIVLTAFMQEFERRLGQKRKGRAGSSLENDTQFILNYFDFKTHDAPEHFTAGLEVDRWVLGKDGWYVGISCKRTLRERWKQVSTTDVDLLNRHKIRELWHVITFDRDLSDGKITEMGSHRQIIYLPDDSPKLAHAAGHPGMRDYVRPMSSFVARLRELTA